MVCIAHVFFGMFLWHVSLVRHDHCELDWNCPYLILLEVVESENIKLDSDLSSIEKTRIEFIDQHFVSYKHENDFLTSRYSRCRNRTHASRRGHHLIHRTRCLIHRNGFNMG